VHKGARTSTVITCHVSTDTCDSSERVLRNGKNFNSRPWCRRRLQYNAPRQSNCTCEWRQHAPSLLLAGTHPPMTEYMTTHRYSTTWLHCTLRIGEFVCFKLTLS